MSSCYTVLFYGLRSWRLREKGYNRSLQCLCFINVSLQSFPFRVSFSQGAWTSTWLLPTAWAHDVTAYSFTTLPHASGSVLPSFPSNFVSPQKLLQFWGDTAASVDSCAPFSSPLRASMGLSGSSVVDASSDHSVLTWSWICSCTRTLPPVLILCRWNKHWIGSDCKHVGTGSSQLHFIVTSTLLTGLFRAMNTKVSHFYSSQQQKPQLWIFKILS